MTEYPEWRDQKKVLGQNLETKNLSSLSAEVVLSDGTSQFINAPIFNPNVNLEELAFDVASVILFEIGNIKIKEVSIQFPNNSDKIPFRPDDLSTKVMYQLSILRRKPNILDSVKSLSEKIIVSDQIM